MISDFFLNIWFGIIDFFAALVPATPVWLTQGFDSIISGIGFVIEKIGYLDPVIPYGSIGLGIALVVGAIGVAVGWQLLRLVISLFTGGGTSV